jgi:hypothetical protein
MHRFQSHYHTQQKKKIQHNISSDQLILSKKKKSTQDQIGSTHTQQKKKSTQDQIASTHTQQKIKKINNSQIYIKKKKNSDLIRSDLSQLRSDQI